MHRRGSKYQTFFIVCNKDSVKLVKIDACNQHACEATTTWHLILKYLTPTLQQMTRQLEQEKRKKPASYNPENTIFSIELLKKVESMNVKFVAIIGGYLQLASLRNGKYNQKNVMSLRVIQSDRHSYLNNYCTYKVQKHKKQAFLGMSCAKLDSSGTTLAVVAACQALGYYDVHLALSEDHTWVVFGENGQHSVEVTWHGKGNEDKRGIPVTYDVYNKSWLYVNGQPVICNRHMEVATIVSNMNPGINATTDSEEVMLLQQALLWLLYREGHLQRYPMAIDNLGDLEEMMPTSGSVPPTKMYEEAIRSAVKCYENQHVYPYTYLGGYCYRNKLYKQALRHWAKAASVIKNVHQNLLHKQFVQISDRSLSQISRLTIPSVGQCDLLNDPECFAYLLEFYDGICEWEEGSATPVLHIGWAKALFNTIAKFDAHVRSHVKIRCIDHQEDDDEIVSDMKTSDMIDADHKTPSQDQNGNMASSPFSFFVEEHCGNYDSSSVEHTPVSLTKRQIYEHILSDKVSSYTCLLQVNNKIMVTMTKKRGDVECNQTGRSKRTRRDG
ncbi:unnamed protein product, partial [Meganyctiphanes norvegica]